jgi:hypothetical protein
MGAGNTGTGVQRVIEATDSQLSAGVGATGDAAATAGSTGSVNAKLRLATTQLDAIQTAVQVIDNAISGTGVNVSQINGVTPLMGAGNTGGYSELTGAWDKLPPDTHEPPAAGYGAPPLALSLVPVARGDSQHWPSILLHDRHRVERLPTLTSVPKKLVTVPLHAIREPVNVNPVPLS